MKIALISLLIIIVLFLEFVYLGRVLRKRQLKRLLEERNNLDLTTIEGKNRAKVINKQIDRIYANFG